MHFSPEKISQDTDGSSIFIEKIEFSFSLTVKVNHVGHFILTKENGRFWITIINSIKRFSFDESVKIVSNNMDLMESSPESFGGWKIANISNTENIGVFSMLESFVINIQHVIRIFVGKSSFN